MLKELELNWFLVNLVTDCLQIDDLISCMVEPSFNMRSIREALRFNDKLKSTLSGEQGVCRRRVSIFKPITAKQTVFIHQSQLLSSLRSPLVCPSIRFATSPPPSTSLHHAVVRVSAQLSAPVTLFIRSTEELWMIVKRTTRGAALPSADVRPLTCVWSLCERPLEL